MRDCPKTKMGVSVTVAGPLTLRVGGIESLACRHGSGGRKGLTNKWSALVQQEYDLST